MTKMPNTATSRTFQEKQLKQRKVKIGIVSGVSGITACFAIAAKWSTHHHPRSHRQDDRVTNDLEAHAFRLALLSLLGPSLCMGVSIAMVANHRLSSPRDIDGSAAVADDKNESSSVELQQKQANLQNTLEQTCYAVPVYLVSSTLLCDFYLTIPAASVMFVVGRICFYAGGKGGVNYGRLIGFALTFLPTNLLVLANVVVLVSKVFAVTSR